MRHVRRTTIVISAALGLSILMTGSTYAALPEFSPTTGAVQFSSGKSILETLGGGTKVECSGGSASGQITSEKEITHIGLKFAGCKAAGFSCNSSLGSPGEIQVKNVTGKLGYINKAGKEVGLLFKPAEGKEFTEFNCIGGIIKVKILGLVICPITPVNTVVKVYTLKCEQKEGDQKPTKFEGGETEVLKMSFNGAEEQDSAEELVASVTTNTASEILV